MPAYVLMKAFESLPARYDAAMDFVTLGRISRLKQAIVSTVKGKGQVLELGCGTGTLAVQMAKTGARVLGIDTSESMLETARRRVGAQGVARRVQLRRLSLMAVEVFGTW